jgi:hypothetical protein
MTQSHPDAEFPEETREQVIDRALTLRLEGRIDLAIETLREAVSHALADPELVILLAKMVAESGDLERAEGWFAHALKLAPTSHDVRLGYAVWRLESGDIPAGKELLEALHVDVLKRERSGLNPKGFRAAVELNLATACVETDDLSRAVALARPWLTDEDGWGQAHNVMVDATERLGLEPRLVTEVGFMTGLFSPYMCVERLERLLDGPPHEVDFSKIEETIILSDANFAFDWRRCDEVVVAVLANARQAAARAMMRGWLEAGACPSLSSDVWRPDHDPDPDDDPHVRALRPLLAASVDEEELEA